MESLHSEDEEGLSRGHRGLGQAWPWQEEVERWFCFEKGVAEVPPSVEEAGGQSREEAWSEGGEGGAGCRADSRHT